GGRDVLVSGEQVGQHSEFGTGLGHRPACGRATAERCCDRVEADGFADAVPDRARRCPGGDGQVELGQVANVHDRPPGARLPDVDAGAALGGLGGEQAVDEAAAVAVDHAGADDPAAGAQHALLDGGPAGRDWVRSGGAVLVLGAGAEDRGAGGIEQRATRGGQGPGPRPVRAVIAGGAGVNDPVVAGRGGGERARLGQVSGDAAVAGGQRGASGPVQGRDVVPSVGEGGGDVGADVAAGPDDQ